MDVVEHVCDRVIVASDGEVVADDTVDDSLDLFRTQASEVTVGGGVPPEVREHLASTDDAGPFDRTGDRGPFEVSVTGEESCGLVDDLREAGLAVHEFDPIDPDHEEVFLESTSDDSEGTAGGRVRRAGRPRTVQPGPVRPRTIHPVTALPVTVRAETAGRGTARPATNWPGTPSSPWQLDARERTV